jgi:hypothetical protein
MIKGNIATPNVDPKTWRSRGRKKRPQPAMASAIVTPALMQKRPTVGNQETEQPKRSAIVEPKRRPNSMHPHLLDHDGSEAEHRRRGELADELLREIKRRVAATKRRD